MHSKMSLFSCLASGLSKAIPSMMKVSASPCITTHNHLSLLGKTGIQTNLLHQVHILMASTFGRLSRLGFSNSIAPIYTPNSTFVMSPPENGERVLPCSQVVVLGMQCNIQENHPLRSLSHKGGQLHTPYDSLHNS